MSLSESQRATLKLFCDTIVPAIEHDPDPDGFWARRASELGVEQGVEELIADLDDELQAGLCELLDALDSQNRARMQEEMGRLLASGDANVCKTMVLVTHSIEEAILLSDHVVVLTRRPGHVKADLVIDLPRPRREVDPRFAEWKQHIRDLVHDEYEPER